jgi:hypothetical protein
MNAMRFTIKAKLVSAFGIVILLSVAAPPRGAASPKPNGYAGNGVNLDLAAADGDAQDREFVQY